MPTPVADPERPLRSGAVSVLALIVGVIPFGLVFGAAAADGGLSLLETQAFSVGIFAGASQIAALELLIDDSAVWLAVVTAWVINLRMLMYSASLAPYFSHLPRGERMGGAYLLTDQAYAVSIVRFEEGWPVDRRLRFYLGAGLALWTTWQVTTLLGALLGNVLPDDVPLDFAIPLVFLALLIPTLQSVPTVLAAVTAGVVATVAAQVGAGDTSILAGALCGIAAGTLAAARLEPGREV